MNEFQLLSMAGKKIRSVRMHKNMTQDDLSVKCNFEKARLSRIENGRANPTVRSLHKICEALEIRLADLFCD